MSGATSSDGLSTDSDSDNERGSEDDALPLGMGIGGESR